MKPEEALALVDKSGLGISIGNLPAEVVDKLFTGMMGHVLLHHPPAVRAYVIGSFAAAQVEAEIATNPEVDPQVRLRAAQQLRRGFADTVEVFVRYDRAGASTPTHSPPEEVLKPKGSVDSKLSKRYGKVKGG